jgi:hypothetical protein
MKLTNSKLKQLIKEAFDEEEFLATVPEGEEEGEDLGGETIDTVDEFMKTAEAFYDRLPEDKKRALTQGFEDAFNKWEEELEGAPEEEYEEEEEKYAPSTEYTSPSFRTARMESGYFQGKN